MTQTEKLREKIDGILTRYGNFIDGYDAEGNVLDIDEALEAILKACKEAGLKFVETVTPPSLQDPGADTYPIVRGINV